MMLCPMLNSSIRGTSRMGTILRTSRPWPAKTLSPMDAPNAAAARIFASSASYFPVRNASQYVPV
jgi:hypothetical protein